MIAVMLKRNGILALLNPIHTTLQAWHNGMTRQTDGSVNIVIACWNWDRRWVASLPGPLPTQQGFLLCSYQGLAFTLN